LGIEVLIFSLFGRQKPCYPFFMAKMAAGFLRRPKVGNLWRRKHTDNMWSMDLSMI